MGVIPPNPLYGKPLRDNEQRAKTAMLLIWIVLGAEILSLGSSVARYFLLRGLQQGVKYSEFILSANDLREGVIGILYTVVSVISAVTFIRWFRRAYYNLHTRVPHLSWDEGWAAGAWFVPFLNLVRPCQIMKELYREIRKVLLNRGLIQTNVLCTDSITAWWALWIISNILSHFILRMSLRAESVDELLLVTIGNIAVEVLGIPLAIVTVKVIRDYARVEPALRGVQIDRDTPKTVEIQEDIPDQPSL